MHLIRNFVLFVFIVFVSSGLQADILDKGKGKKKKKKEKQESVTKSNDEKGEYAFVKGMNYFLKKDFTSAIQAFNEVLAHSHHNAAAYSKLAECFYALKTPAKAVYYAKKAIEYDPSNTTYYLLIAEIYVNEGLYDEAIKAYEELLTKVPDAYEHYMDLAELCHDVGMYAMSRKEIAGSSKKKSVEKDKNEQIKNYLLKSVNAFDKIEERYGVMPETSFKKQKIYLTLNNVDKALQEANKLINEFPEDLIYKLSLAELYYANNQVQKAINFCKDIIATHPKEVEPYLLLAQFYTSQGQTQKADEQLEIAFGNPNMDIDDKVRHITSYFQQINDPQKRKTALRLAKKIAETYPDKAPAQSVYGDILYLTEQKEEARDQYLKALKYDNDKFLIWQQVIILDFEIGDYDSLIVHAEKAVSLFPEKALLYFYKGTAHLIKKQDSLAVVAMEKGLAVCDEEQLRYQFNAQLGDAYNNIKEYAKADNAYEEALTFDPNNAHVLNNYSYFLSLRKENLTKAKSMSERLVRMYPNEATYLDTYAWVLYMMEDYTSAKKYLEKALLTSDDGTIIEHYGDVLFRLGKEEEALKQWEKAKLQGGASELIDKKIEDKKLHE